MSRRAPTSQAPYNPAHHTAIFCLHMHAKCPSMLLEGSHNSRLRGGLHGGEGQTHIGAGELTSQLHDPATYALDTHVARYAVSLNSLLDGGGVGVHKARLEQRQQLVVLRAGG